VPIAELFLSQAATFASKVAWSFFQDWRDGRRPELDVAVHAGQAAPLTSTPRGALRPVPVASPAWLAVEFMPAGSDAATDLDVDDPVLVVVQDAHDPDTEGLIATDTVDGGLLFELRPGTYNVVAFVLDEQRDRLLGYGTQENLRLFGGEDLTLTLAMTTQGLDWVAAQLFGDPGGLPMLVDADGNWCELLERVLVGRAPECDLIIADPSVSQHHAELVRTVDGYELRDAGSRNGSYVNGSRVEHALLQHGDVVAFGDVGLRFLLG